MVKYTIQAQVGQMNSTHVIATQLELSGGLRRDRGECLVDAELLMPPPTLQKRGTLYIITEIEGGNRAEGKPRQSEQEMCHDAQMAILKEYYDFNPNASVTSALRHALEIANQLIFNRNSSLLPPDRRGVGVTVALVRNNELYLAQMPPSLALVVHQGQLSYYPPDGRKRGPQLIKQRETMPLRHSAAHPALGRYGAVEPIFNRTLFEDGDLLVLCSATLVNALTEDQIERYFIGVDSREALYNLSDFARIQNLGEGYAMAVGVKGDYSAGRLYQTAQERSEFNATRPEDSGFRNAVEGVAASVSHFASKFVPSRDRQPEAAQEDYVFETSIPQAEAVRWNEDYDFVDKKPRQAPIAKGNQGSMGDNNMSDDPNSDPWLHREDDNLQTPPYLRNTPSSKSPEENEPFRQQQAGAYQFGQTPAEPKNSTFKPGTYKPNEARKPQPDSNFKTPQPEFDFSNVAEETPAPAPTGKKRERKGQGEFEPETTDSPYFEAGDNYGPPLDSIRDERRFGGFRPPRNLIIVGLVVLLGVAVLFLVFAALNSNVTNNKALDFVKSAETKRTQAQGLATSNPEQARKLIVQAQDDLASARKEKPDLKEIGITQNALKVTLDNINKVVVPADLRLSVDLGSQGAGLKLSRAILNPTGDAVFLLDSGRGQVMMLDLEGQVKTILKTGDAVGGKTFKNPVAMAARLDSVVVVDDSNVIWLYDRANSKWNVAQLGGSAGWASPLKRLDTYQGNLYIIGPAGSQILRYLSGAYANPPDEWLSDSAAQTAQLDKSASLAIDGNIYALSPNGMLFQMARPNGKNKGEIIGQFDLSNAGKVGPAINNLTNLYIGTLDSPYIFVTDGEKRVLQFEKSTGAFIQQFKSDGKEFDSIRDLLVDEPNQKLYVISDQRIYVSRIPAAVTSSVPVVANTPLAATPSR